jgi:hypothetical protein
VKRETRRELFRGIIPIVIARQCLPVADRATFRLATQCVILSPPRPANAARLAALCSPFLALVAVSDARMLNSVLRKSCNGLSALKRLDLFDVHLLTIVNLKVWVLR